MSHPWSSPHSSSHIAEKSGKLFKLAGKSGISRRSVKSFSMEYSGSPENLEALPSRQL